MFRIEKELTGLERQEAEIESKRSFETLKINIERDAELAKLANIKDSDKKRLLQAKFTELAANRIKKTGAKADLDIAKLRLRQTTQGLNATGAALNAFSQLSAASSSLNE